MVGGPTEVRDTVIGPRKAYWTYRLMVDSTTAADFMKPLPGGELITPFELKGAK
jgi:hypothetical protein